MANWKDWVAPGVVVGAVVAGAVYISDLSDDIDGKVDGLQESTTAGFSAISEKMESRFTALDAKVDRNFEAMRGDIRAANASINETNKRIDDLYNRITDMATVQANTAAQLRLIANKLEVAAAPIMLPSDNLVGQHDQSAHPDSLPAWFHEHTAPYTAEDWIQVPGTDPEQ